MAAAELQKAIVAKARGNAALKATVKGQIFFEEIGPKAQMPYITFHMISGVPINTFLASSSFEEDIVQFSIFDKRPGVNNIENIYDKLDAVFDRGVLSYDTKTAIGCKRVAKTGPTKVEDAWMLTVDYRIEYQ